MKTFGSRTGRLIAYKARSIGSPVEAHVHGLRLIAYLPSEGDGRLAFEADQHRVRSSPIDYWRLPPTDVRRLEPLSRSASIWAGRQGQSRSREALT